MTTVIVSRLLPTLLLATGAVVTVASQESSLPEPNLRGSVRRMIVVEEVVTGSSASAQGEESRRQEFEFDEGRLVRQNNYVPKDQLAWESTFEYDDAGNIVQWISRDGQGREKWRYEYSYGADGLLEREVLRNGGGRIEEVLVYDYSEGDLVEEIQYGSTNSVRWRKVYSSNNDERLRTWSLFYPDGTRLKQVKEQYDDRGRLVKEIHREGLGTVSLEITYDYGLWSVPRLVSVFDGEGSLVRREDRRLDVGGNVVEEHVSRGDLTDRSELLREYEYDRRGNWVRKRTVHYEVIDGRRAVTREKLTTRDIDYAVGE